MLLLFWLAFITNRIFRRKHARSAVWLCSLLCYDTLHFESTKRLTFPRIKSSFCSSIQMCIEIGFAIAFSNEWNIPEQGLGGRVGVLLKLCLCVETTSCCMSDGDLEDVGMGWMVKGGQKAIQSASIDPLWLTKQFNVNCDFSTGWNRSSIDATRIPMRWCTRH